MTVSVMTNKREPSIPNRKFVREVLLSKPAVFKVFGRRSRFMNFCLAGLAALFYCVILDHYPCDVLNEFRITQVSTRPDGHKVRNLGGCLGGNLFGGKQSKRFMEQ